MRALASAAAVGLALLAAPVVRADAPTYRIDASESTTSVKTGGKGTVAIKIAPAEGYKVNEKGPLGLKLEAPQSIALDKDRLGRSDATGAPTAPEFACGFTARENGEITVHATFIICDEAGTICEMKREKLTVAVDVAD